MQAITYVRVFLYDAWLQINYVTECITEMDNEHADLFRLDTCLHSMRYE